MVSVGAYGTQSPFQSEAKSVDDTSGIFLLTQSPLSVLCSITIQHRNGNGNNAGFGSSCLIHPAFRK